MRHSPALRCKAATTLLVAALACPATSLGAPPERRRDKDGPAAKADAPAPEEKDKKSGKPERALLIHAGAVHVGDGRVLVPGEILVVDGVIREVAESIEAPEGAARWDRPAAVVTPGLVDPAATILLGSREGQAGPQAALLAASDARSPFDPWLDVARSEGLVAACLVPDGTGPVGGRASTIGTSGSGATGAPVLAAEAALVTTIGAGAHGSLARSAAREGLSLLLEQAEEYGRKRKEWKDEHAAAESGPRARRVRPEATGRRSGTKISRDEREPPEQPPFEVLLRVLDKKLPLRARVDRIEDVDALLALLARRGISAVVTGCLECAGRAERLEESRAIVLLAPLEMPIAETAAGEPDPDLVARLASAGVRIAVTGGGTWPHGPGWLRQAAADLAGRGLSREHAVAAMTGLAAEAAGIGATHGKLAKGRIGEMAFWSGDPLEPGTRLLQLATRQDCEAASAEIAPPRAKEKKSEAGKDEKRASAPDEEPGDKPATEEEKKP